MASSNTGGTSNNTSSGDSVGEYLKPVSHWVDLWDTEKHKREFLQFRLNDETTREYVFCMIFFLIFILYSSAHDIYTYPQLTLSLPLMILLVIVVINVCVLVFLKLRRWWEIRNELHDSSQIEYEGSSKESEPNGLNNNAQVADLEQARRQREREQEPPSVSFNSNFQRDEENENLATMIKTRIKPFFGHTTKPPHQYELAYNDHFSGLSGRFRRPLLPPNKGRPQCPTRWHSYHHHFSDFELWVENISYFFLVLSLNVYVAFAVQLYYDAGIDYQLMAKDALPDILVMASLTCPIILYMVMKGVHFSLLIFSLWEGLITAVILMVVYGLNHSWIRTSFSLVFAMFALAEYHRQVWHSYQVNKRLKRSVEENSRLAEEIKANELRHMIGNVAHDLKTPLSSFVSGMEVIQSVAAELHQEVSIYNSKPRAQISLNGVEEKLNTILEVSENVTNTNAFMIMAINRCIDYNKTMFGLKLSPKTDIFLLRESVDFTIKCLQGTYDGHVIIDCIYVSNSLRHGEIMLRSDKQWLQENLLCLVGNAAKYSEKGTSVLIKVSIVQRGVLNRDGISFRQSQRKLSNPNVTPNGQRKSLTSITSAAIAPLIAKSSSGSGKSKNSRIAAYDIEMGKTIDSTEGHTVRISSSGKDNTSLSTGANPSTSQKITSSNSGSSLTSNSSGKYADRFLRVEVIDTGPGIAEEYCEKLFQEPAQAARINGGTGLGLYSMAKRVEALGGDYGVKPRDSSERAGVYGGNGSKNPGSKFWFAIPYHFVSDQSTNNTSTSLPAKVTPAPDSKNSSTANQHHALHFHTPGMVHRGERGVITIDRQPSIDEVDDDDDDIGFERDEPKQQEQKSSSNSSTDPKQDVILKKANSNQELVIVGGSAAVHPAPIVANNSADPILRSYSNDDSISQSYHYGSSRTGDLTGFSSENSAHDVLFSAPLIAEMESHKNNRSMNEIYMSEGGPSNKRDEEKQKRLRVLIVDDSPAILKMTSLALKKQGYDVWTADNGLAALHMFKDEYAKMFPMGAPILAGKSFMAGRSGFFPDSFASKRSPFDIVIMDFQMPIMGGLEAIFEIRQWERQTINNVSTRSSFINFINQKSIIIGFSAKSDEYQIEQAYINGMDGFLSKPFTFASFQSILATLARNG